MATPKLRALTELRTKIQEASDAYFNGEPLMTDAEFDTLVDRLARASPADPLLAQVGAMPRGGKVELPYPMMSLDKVKDAGVLSRWAAKQTPPFALSDKLDGTSALITFDKAKNNGVWGVRMYRRGTGSVGADITHLLKHLVPGELCKSGDKIAAMLQGVGDKVAVRGEIIMRRDVYLREFATQFKDARCLVNSLVNRKDLDGSARALEGTAFVAYEIVHPRMPRAEQLTALERAGFQVVPYTLSERISMDTLGDLFVSRRAESPYYVDGIVVEGAGVHSMAPGKNPTYAVAFKMDLEEQGGETTVVDVVYEASKDGLLVPRVNYKPVVVNGVTLQWATGFNARFIRDSGIGPGAQIRVIRSGEVIPKIVAVMKPADEAALPGVPYEWDDNEVHVRLRDPGSDPAVAVKRIVKFFTALGIENVKEGLVKRFYAEGGMRTIKAYLVASEADFRALSGVSDVLAKKLYSNVQNGIKDADAVKVMCGSNVFGAGIGERKLRAVLAKYPDMLVRAPSLQELCAIESMQQKTAEKVLAGIEEFNAWMAEHAEITLARAAAAVARPRGAFSSEVVVFSGFRDADLQARIEAAGGTVAANITKLTTLLVATGESGKVKKARELGIRVIPPDELTV